MRGLMMVLATLAVLGSGFWVYVENYDTQASIKTVRQLDRDIDVAQARAKMLSAEWAYLNRPDRLRDLADLNFDRLGLLPMSPDSFGEVNQVLYPTAPLAQVTASIAVSSDGGAAQ